MWNAIRQVRRNSFDKRMLKILVKLAIDDVEAVAQFFFHSVYN